MKIKKTLFTIALCIAFSTVSLLISCRKSPNNPGPSGTTTLPPQNWTKIKTLPESEKFIVLETDNNTIYAASGSGFVYSSSDLGSTWHISTIVKQGGTVITTLALFNHIIYAGTYFDGIFSSSDNGKTWINQSHSIPQVSSFLVWNNKLYASSAAQGIYALDGIAGQWNLFNDKGIPTNYSIDVEKIITNGTSIISAQGVNGTFYTFDKTLNEWHEGYYSGNNLLPGLAAEDIIYDQGTLFASVSVSSKGILRSDDNGLTWTEDTVGLKRKLSSGEPPRSIYAGSKKYYTFFAEFGGTWIQQKDRPSPVGATWAGNNEFLALKGYAYSIRELNGALFLAADDGLYYRRI